MASKTQEKRWEMQDYVRTGNVTIGRMKEHYGFTGLRHLAGRLRSGHYRIDGLPVARGLRADSKADKALADQLETMDPNTRIVFVEAPPRRTN
jgi:hypothetical protein